MRGDFPRTAVVTAAERSFIYLFISSRGLSSCSRGRRSMFVCSVSTNMFLKVHHGTPRKAPAGGRRTSCSRWTSFGFPSLTASGSVSSAFVRRGSSSAFRCSPTGVSLISLHVELPSTRLGPVLHVNSLSFCLLLYLQSNTDGHATTAGGGDGRGVSSQRQLAVTVVLRPSLLGSSAPL